MRWIILVLCLIALPALADQRNYTITVAGFNAGFLSISDTTSRSNYRVAARVTSAGIAALFGRTTYDGKADGRILNGRLFPTRYQGQIVSGDRSSAVSLSYRSSVPAIIQYEPRPPAYAFTIDPKSQRGTVDILTSAYWVFRERPADELCDVTYFGFDGIRRTQVTLGPATQRDGTFVCTGTYSRIAGFSERALRRGRDFPLTLTYIPAGTEGFVLDELSARTVFGPARVKRAP